MQAFEGASVAGTTQFEDPSGLFGASQRYVSILQSHRQDEEVSRKHRGQRRARYVINLTESYRKTSDEARNRLLKEKATMRSQKEFSMLSQLAEITKWHEVIRANATSRQQVRDQNEVNQREMHEQHLENLKEHLYSTAERQKDDDTRRWKALIEKRRLDKEQEISNICRSLVEEAVGRAGDIIGYAADHDLPMPITESIPSVLIEQWQRSHLASEAAQEKKLMQDHVSLELYGYRGEAPHNSAVVTMLCKALSTLRPPAPPTRPENPQAWPLIFVTGPRYSGKSVVAETVANHLGMLYFSDQSLVNAAIEELQQDFTTEDLSDPAKSELVDIGHALQKALLDGGVVPIDLMARLIGHCVRTAPEDCSGMIIDGVQITVEAVKAIEAILSGYHDPVEDETLLLAPESANDPDQFAARLNVSRPMTAITEVAATQGREKTKGNAKKKKEEDEPLPPIDIPPLFNMAPLSKAERKIVEAYQGRANVLGIAKIVAIECDADQLFDRVAKVRFDVESGEEYHLDFNPPPEDRLQYLQIRDRPDQDCGNMFAQIESYGAHWEPTERWLQSFGSVQCSIHGGELREMVDDFQSVVVSAAEERRVYCHTVSEARRIMAHRDELTAQQREHNKRRDATKRQLLALYTERQVDPMPSVLIEPDWEASQPVEMTPTLANVLLETLTGFTANYTETVKTTHESLNATLTAFYEHTDHCAERFELFWKQPDGRQDVLDAFLAKDLELDRNLYVLTATKEEMHYRIDTLQADLWRLVDTRKAEAIALIEQLCAKTTIVEAVNEAIRGLGAALVQSELDRFLMVRHLALTYFSALKDAPMPLDLTDVIPSEVIPQLKGGIATEKEADVVPAGKGAAKKAPPKKGKAAPAPEELERPQEDMLNVVKAKAVAMMEALVDKLTIVSQAPAKNKKGVVEITRADANAPGTMATPVVEEEMRVTDLRMETIVEYFNGIADNVVVAQTNRLWGKFAASLQTHYTAQLAAVNAVILYLRNRVELETPPVCKLVLGLEAFAEDSETPLFPKEVTPCETPILEEGEEIATEAASEEIGIAVEDGDDDDELLTSCLTFKRADAIIKLFRLCAPDYRLHKKDFVRIITAEDYDCASEEVAAVDEVFDRFDDWGAGVIDWRLFMLHLLFWCEPINATERYYAIHGPPEESFGQEGVRGPVRRNKFYIENPSFFDLLELRGGWEEAPFESEEDFVNASHFFENNMSSERYSSYCAVLWSIFVTEEGVVVPQTVLTFLCPADQPIRGLQQAFGVVPPEVENCEAIIPEWFDMVFHMFANNPRALGIWDPCSVTAQQVVYEAFGTPTFEFEELETNPAARIIINSYKSYQRKSFVK